MSHLPRQQGFSLLELLLVLGLMATAAVLALSAVSNDDNQRRFDETRSKLERLRVGIVGEPLVINDELSLNGFVADMGRLPLNLEELLENPDDCDPITAGDQACDWSYDPASEIWSGWHGPYINTINLDFRDGWGNDSWDWDDTTITGDLSIASYGLDTDLDIATNNILGTDASYGDSTLQTVSINNLAYAVQLPSSPLYLTVEKAPFCGQCQDLDPTHQTNTSCIAAGHDWDGTKLYCVEDTATSASSCDSVTTEATIWAPVYGYCSDAPFNSQATCESTGASWTELPTLLSCTGPPLPLAPDAEPLAPLLSFIETSNVDGCTHIIHSGNGSIITNTHESSDATMMTITEDIEQSSIGEETFSYEPVMEDTDNPGMPSLILPQGNMRVGLFIYDTATTTCTEDPFPSISSQARSDIITLSSDYPPNIGTSSNPITLHWRSR